MRLRHFLIGISGTLWLTLAVLAFIGLSAYALQPGARGNAQNQWPEQSKLSRSERGATLLVFLHPECSCSEATAEELDYVLARIPSSTKTIAVFVRPAQWTDTQLKGKLWRRVQNISGVDLQIDRDGSESTLFGAKTSGHTQVYDRSGALVFSGGITASRGHAGDNAGVDSVTAILNSKSASQSQTDVFGCGLFDGPLSTVGRFIASMVAVVR